MTVGGSLVGGSGDGSGSIVSDRNIGTVKIRHDVIGGSGFDFAEGYGWTVPTPSFDWPTLIANKDKEIARLETAYTANLARANVDDRQEPRRARRCAHRPPSR